MSSSSAAKTHRIGEMISRLAGLGVSVPGGFATTSHAYRDFLAQDGLDERIRALLAALDVDDVERLAAVGAQIRGWMLATPFPARLQREVLEAWRRMGTGPRNSRSRCARRRPRKICRKPPSPASRKPS